MKKIRLGILGARRGLSFLRLAVENEELMLEVTAICDNAAFRLRGDVEKYNVRLFEDFDEMLKSDIDAVMLANYFHQHTSFAIKALKAGKHVLSETTSAGTMKECVELCEAVENSNKVYMLAENYAFSKIGLEMKNQYDKNKIGEVLYGEGEYVHPINAPEFNKISIGDTHWRNWAPSTYYCTHALAPLMYFTNTYPVSVNALSIERDKMLEGTVKRCDPVSVILCRMNNGAVFRLYGWNSPGHSVWYRMHGERGSMEAPRAYDGGYFGNGMLRISVDSWLTEEGEHHTSGYLCDWPEEYKKVGTSGHGGGDYVVTKIFSEAVKNNKSPEFFDVYKGVYLSAVGILGWKSALSNGAPVEIIDFKDKEMRKAYLKDDLSPFPDSGKPSIQSSLKGERVPSEEDRKNAEKIWNEIMNP
ncbi:MAG: Gfo/Idh/MocA family oxidoreductase [Clostridia bacterium]|nr:Gfo/Idh/MocA family oxidoreductase [Clostridia bacterium]